MNKSECFHLGYISKTIGFKGEIMLSLNKDFPADCITIKSVFIELSEQMVPFFIEKFQIKNSHCAIVQLEGIDASQKAEELVKANLYIPLNLLPPLKGKRFYFHEIIGFRVIDRLHGNIGLVEEILDFPSQKIIKIRKDSMEILIPLTDAFIVNIDRENKVLKLDTPEGLIEIYTGNPNLPDSENSSL